MSTTFTPREGQNPPIWSIWGLSAPRGAGKTFAALQYFNSVMDIHPGYRGLIVVPRATDISAIAEALQEINPNIGYSPSIRRLTWSKHSERAEMEVYKAREILARVADLPKTSRVYREAKLVLDEAIDATKVSNSSAFLTSSDAADTIRGIQTNITLLDSMEDFLEPQPDEVDGHYTSMESRIGAGICARIATRLGKHPQIVITHTPDFPKPWPEDTTYTLDTGSHV